MLSDNLSSGESLAEQDPRRLRAPPRRLPSLGSGIMPGGPFDVGTGATCTPHCGIVFTYQSMLPDLEASYRQAEEVRNEFRLLSQEVSRTALRNAWNQDFLDAEAANPA